MEELSFEQRLKKTKIGYKKKSDAKPYKEVVLEKEKELKKVNKGRKQAGMPREVYSKRRLGDRMMGDVKQKEKSRDPRFEQGEKINKGLYEASYKFVDEMAKDREKDIKHRLSDIKKKKKLNDDEQQEQQKLFEILNEETNWRKKKYRDLSSQNNKYLKKAKEMNKERAKKGLAPIFYKKRELKEMKYKDDFDRFDKQGKVEKEISKAFRKL